MRKLEIAGKIIVLILIIALIGLLTTKKKEQQANQQVLAEQADYINGVKKEIKQKKEEIQNLKEEREKDINEKVTITFCIDQMTPNLFDQVKPIFDSYQWKGVFVIENGMLPGSDNTITKKQYDQLIEEGWEVAIGGWDDLKLEKKEDRDVWAARLDDLIVQMRQSNMDVPTSYYFKRNQDVEECTEILKERGFRVVCSYENPDHFYGLSWEKKWNQVGVYPISQSNYKIEEQFSEWESHKAAVVLSTRYIGTVESKDLDCDAAAYRTVLETIRVLEEEERVEVFSLSKMCETRQKTYAEADRQDSSYADRLMEKQKELEKLEEEWEQIFEGEVSINREDDEEESTEEEMTEKEKKEETTEEETTEEEKKEETTEEETTEEEKKEEKTTEEETTEKEKKEEKTTEEETTEKEKKEEKTTEEETTEKEKKKEETTEEETTEKKKKTEKETTQAISSEQQETVDAVFSVEVE